MPLRHSLPCCWSRRPSVRRWDGGKEQRGCLLLAWWGCSASSCPGKERGGGHHLASHTPLAGSCCSALHPRAPVPHCSDFSSGNLNLLPTSYGLHSSTCTDSHTVFSYGKPSSHLSPKPAVTPWNFPGRASCRATVVSLSPQEWAAEINVLGLSLCVALHSLLFLQMPSFGEVCKSVSSTDLALITAANMGNHISISNSHWELDLMYSLLEGHKLGHKRQSGKQSSLSD